MKNQQSVFIATSIDGYIADRNGKIDWLNSIPNPDNNDMGYHAFMQRQDAIVMGRKTFETVLGFDIDWPYDIPVFVLSRQYKNIPDSLREKAFLVSGTATEILSQIHEKGFHRLYIDGGSTIRSFLEEDLIDDMTLTIIPILLGGGTSLFGDMASPLSFELTDVETFQGRVVQCRYKRKRDV